MISDDSINGAVYSKEQEEQIREVIGRIVPALAEERFEDVERELQNAMRDKLDVAVITGVYQHIRRLKLKSDPLAEKVSLSDLSRIVHTIRKKETG